MYSIAKPFLFRIEPETAHRWTLAALARWPGRADAHDPRLAIAVAGLRFPSPVALAAGFDKDGVALRGLPALGFGAIELGTVTPVPQPGNPRPRLFRLVEDRAVINRMGFNNGGQAGLAARLRDRTRGACIVGANIGANKDAVDRIADYAAGVRTLSPHADYLTVNISSPNTPGLRALQDRGALADLLAAVRDARGAGGPPVFLKVAPDLDAQDVPMIVRTAIDHGVDAIIVANTTIARPPLASRHAGEAGGLSGAPLAPLALAQLRAFAAASGGTIPLIAAGGIDSAAAAWARICAGAALVQLYSALVYEGPGLVPRINAGLAARVTAAGLATIGEAVGREDLLPTRA